MAVFIKPFLRMKFSHNVLALRVCVVATTTLNVSSGSVNLSYSHFGVGFGQLTVAVLLNLVQFFHRNLKQVMNRLNWHFNFFIL